MIFDRQSYTSLNQGYHFLVVSQQLAYPQKGGAVDLIHFKRHQSVLVQSHVLLLVRVEDLQHFLQYAVFTALVETLHGVAELKKLLFGRIFVEVDHNGLNYLLVALLSSLQLH